MTYIAGENLGIHAAGSGGPDHCVRVDDLTFTISAGDSVRGSSLFPPLAGDTLEGTETLEDVLDRHYLEGPLRPLELSKSNLFIFTVKESFGVFLSLFGQRERVRRQATYDCAPGRLPMAANSLVGDRRPGSQQRIHPYHTHRP